MAKQEGWQVVSNKKFNHKKVIPSQTNTFQDPIIARQREAHSKLEADKLALKQIKYGEQKDSNANWEYMTLSKTKHKPKVSLPQREATSIKENADGDVKIKKVSKSMAKAIVDARVAKQWTQVQLAHNSAIDTKTIGEIERGRCVYNANVFNKLCKTLGINVVRNVDLN